jgi:hypothetical protein
MAEILSKPRLEIGSCCIIERPPRRAQDVVYDRGSLGGVPFGHVRPPSLDLFVLLAGGAFAVELYRRGRDRKLRGRHAHDLIGDAVRLGLERVVRAADGEFAL